MQRQGELLVRISLMMIVVGSSAGVAGDATVDFVRDVRPLLVRHCDRCHGIRNQEGGLQLNVRSAAMSQADTEEPIIVSGDADASLLILRLTESDAGDIMPLDGEPLSARDIDTLRTWVNQAAEWPDEFAEAGHWAWESIERPELPDPDSSTAAIDQFVRGRLERESLDHSERLDRPRLIRRASLALIGVPPTPEDVRAFSDDKSPNAFEKVVDRLLESPRYGERWAVPWMDLARYADSNGYQADQLRDNWAWRDWVIRAFNDDMPFDDFVIDQLAGDLRPDATVDQKVATGFHRMTTCNVEAGVRPEANRVDQIVDRVNTTATVFLGVTLECAQCHDHKYDPFTQEDYYRFFAYFNNTPLEVKNTSGVTWDFFGPKMDLPLAPETASRKRQLEQELTDLSQVESRRRKDASAEIEAWRARLLESQVVDSWQVVHPESFESTGKDKHKILDDGSILLSGPVPVEVEHTIVFRLPHEPVTAIRLETLTHASLPLDGPGRFGFLDPDVHLRDIRCEVVRGGDVTPVKIQFARADTDNATGGVGLAIDGRSDTAWSIAPKFRKPHEACFVLNKPVGSVDSDDRLRITLSQGRYNAGRPRLSITHADPQFIDVTKELIEAAQSNTPTEEQAELLKKQFFARDRAMATVTAKISSARFDLGNIEPETSLVMVEMAEPRETHILTRGDYEQPADRVSPGTPTMLPAGSSVERSGDRMELARWLTSDENPLLARVTVNRWWHDLFGTGLVTTPEDFGTQSEPPSHPRLLDWLASELISSGWSMKQIHKHIVMSETWQQSARCSGDLRAKDPSNRLLARGPRFRLPAESIRDNALAISGLLSTKMYGEPIMPFQPNGVWRSVGRNQPRWKAARNEDRFRRGVYVVCKRAAPYPSFITFDAPDRGACTVKRPRSNTPLQALTLLNDRAYAEMAMEFAGRVLEESTDATDSGRIRYAMQLAVARNARDFEVDVLQRLLNDERRRLANDGKLVEARLKNLPPGDSRASLNPETAAWFAVTNAILNLDETMTQ